MTHHTLTIQVHQHEEYQLREWLEHESAKCGAERSPTLETIPLPDTSRFQHSVPIAMVGAVRVRATWQLPDTADVAAFSDCILTSVTDLHIGAGIV